MTTFLVPSTQFLPHHIKADSPEEAIELGKKMDEAAAADAERVDELAAQPPAPRDRIDPSELTIQQVIERTSGDPVAMSRALEDERSGKNRKSLVEALTALLEQ